MKVRLRLAIVILMPLLLSGCWDFEEVDRRSFATTIGVDAAPQGQVVVSVQIPLPQKMLPPGTKSESEGKLFSTISLTGITVNDAFNNMQTKSYRDLVVQQNKSIIIGKDAARRGIEPLLEFLARNPKAPPQAFIFVTKNYTAKDILTFAPVERTLPGLMFGQSAQERVKYNRTFYIPLWQFEQKLVHETKDPYATLISVDQEEGVFIEEGLAVFNKDRLSGELNGDETQMVGVLTGIMKKGSLTVSFPHTYTRIRKVTLRNVSSKTRIKVLLKSNRPFFKLKVDLYGQMDELAGWGHRETTPADIRNLERNVKRTITPKIGAVIHKLQGFNSDILDFGEQLRVQHLQVWNRINWKKVYPSVDFKMDLQVHIWGNGVLY
jgi:spore germination protein KC